MPLTALIVEDETRAANVLKQMLHSECEQIEKVWHCTNLNDGQLVLSNESPTVAFLDIHLPDGNGFELVSPLHQAGTEVIFTSAHSEYAIKALRHSAKDYLLKPYSKNELKAALQRALKNEKVSPKPKTPSKILLHTERFTHLVDQNDIVFCKADRNYTKVYLCNGDEIILSKTLKQFEVGLHPYKFIRVHRSYLVNMQFIVGLEKQDGGSLILEGGTLVPISVRKKESVLAAIKRLSGCSL